jgi:hypothetical protein
MGKINCNKHGVGGIALVCSHIREAVDSGNPGPAHKVVDVDQFDDPELLTRIFLCDSCMHAFGLVPDVVLTDIPDGLQPVCSKCLLSMTDDGLPDRSSRA